MWYVKSGSQESNSGSIRLSFCLWDKGLPDSPGSSTKPSTDFPLLPRPLKTVSGEGDWIRGSYIKQSSPSLWGWLCQALRRHNVLVKVWWIAQSSQRAIWVPIEKSSTQGKNSANYASLHQSYLDGNPMGHGPCLSLCIVQCWGNIWHSINTNPELVSCPPQPPTELIWGRNSLWSALSPCFW